MEIPKEFIAQPAVHRRSHPCTRPADAPQQWRRLVPSVALFGAGLLVGAGLALLFAPSSGRELREELGERAAELRDRATGAAESTSSQFPSHHA